MSRVRVRVRVCPRSVMSGEDIYHLQCSRVLFACFFFGWLSLLLLHASNEFECRTMRANCVRKCARFKRSLNRTSNRQNNWPTTAHKCRRRVFEVLQCLRRIQPVMSAEMFQWKCDAAFIMLGIDFVHL